jgi:hypothetical protein
MGAPELDPIELSPDHQARMEEARGQAAETHAAGMEAVLADATASSRRLLAKAGLSKDQTLYGDLCITCEERYALRADKASCAHKVICEDCWPKGCPVCEDELEAGIRHRERVTNGIVQAAMELRTLADDLSETDLGLLDWRVRKDVLSNVELTLDSLRRITDTLNKQGRL